MRTREPRGARCCTSGNRGWLYIYRTFFCDCQEWEWIGRRFDPACALTVPHSVAALIGTTPRVIADKVWAKLLRAGLNLAHEA